MDPDLISRFGIERTAGSVVAIQDNPVSRAIRAGGDVYSGRDLLVGLNLPPLLAGRKVESVEIGILTANEQGVLENGGSCFDAVFKFLLPFRLARFEVQHVQPSQVISKSHQSLRHDRLPRNGSLGFKCPKV